MIPLSHPPPQSRLDTTVLPQLPPIVFFSSFIGHGYDSKRKSQQKTKEGSEHSRLEEMLLNRLTASDSGRASSTATPDTRPPAKEYGNRAATRKCS